MIPTPQRHPYPKVLRPRNSIALIASICALGLTTGVSLNSLNRPCLAMADVEAIAVEGDRPHQAPSTPPSLQASTQPTRGYTAPKDLGLPTRREPGGTR